MVDLRSKASTALIRAPMPRQYVRSMPPAALSLRWPCVRANSNVRRGKNVQLIGGPVASGMHVVRFTWTGWLRGEGAVGQWSKQPAAD
jgi:hypothetical protein